MVIGKVEIPPEQSAAVPVTARVSLYPEGPRTETGLMGVTTGAGRGRCRCGGPWRSGLGQQGVLERAPRLWEKASRIRRGPTPSRRPLTPESPQHAGNRATRGSEGTPGRRRCSELLLLVWCRTWRPAGSPALCARFRTRQVPAAPLCADVRARGHTCPSTQLPQGGSPGRRHYQVNNVPGGLMVGGTHR